MTEHPQQQPAPEEYATRESLEGLRRQVEGMHQEHAYQLAELRQRVRDLALDLEMVKALLQRKPGRHFDVMDAGQHESGVARTWRTIRRRVGLRTRLKAIGRWCARVGRAMFTRDDDSTKGGER